MKKINLLNHQGLSFEGFKTWLNQLILDKKGALPDLNDWKEIKANLDRVSVPKEDKQNLSPKPKVWVDYTNIKKSDDRPYIPWMSSIEDEMCATIDDDMDMHMDLLEELEYYLDKVETGTSVPASYLINTTYNGNPVQLEMNYDKAKENDNNLNNSCSGT
jgi:hypothetical protein